jgi:hypothetical protein
MFPLCQFACQGEYDGNIHDRILEPNALVRTATEDEVVLRILVCGGFWVKPTFREESIRIGEDFGVMQCVVEGWYDHAARRDSVIIRDRERLGG